MAACYAPPVTPVAVSVHGHPRQYKLVICSRGCRVVCRNAAPASSSPVTAKPAASEIVDQLLAEIRNTDAGAAASDAQRLRVQELAAAAEASAAGSDARSDPRLFGDYRVSYTSSPQAAGGRFRSTLGRALFRTHALYQNVVQPGDVVNRVEFALFGCVPGSIGLRGPFRPCEPLRVVPRSNVVAGEGSLLSASAAVYDGAVEVAFDAPVLEVAGDRVTLGGASSVRLATTFVDDRIRIGRGGFGSLFIFERMADGQQQAEALPCPPSMKVVGALFARGGLALFALLSLVADAIRLTRRAVTTPGVLVSTLVMAAAWTGALTSGLSMAAVSPAVQGAAHVLCAGLWLGATTWVSFFQGDILFKLIPRATFTTLRAQLRPRLLYAGSVMGALALATMHTAEAASQHLLRCALFAHAINLLVAEPSGARLSAFRATFEADVGIGAEIGCSPDNAKLTPTIRRLNQRITRWRGVSASLSIVSLAALAAHLATVGTRLASL